MLESVLIANRGEVAARIARACRDAGVRSIAVYSDADRCAEHVLLADEAHHLGPTDVHRSYLAMDRLLEVARTSRAAAVHPGYGLLSENAQFAQRVQAAGLTFVGPDPRVIDLLGDKRTAREQAQAVGLPVLPARLLADDDDPIAAAGDIGYPLLVKAAFGGGGRGMRLVRAPDALAEALQQAGRENQAAFGRAEVYLERFLSRARHVEVQVLADAHGSVRQLGTRDCTTQRRNQKLIEEAPAFRLDPDLEQQAVAGSLRLALRVGYRGAATVEFLVGHDPAELFFLEVNTRLQVEHTVTELVTGIDIVVAQLAVASGEPLPSQDSVRLTGHAIQARVNAEDPAVGFLPQTGTVQALRLPSGPWVRVDTGIAAGSVVTSSYDSLLAKITTWGPDRATARARLERALAETVVDGVPTTTGYLTRVLGDARFRAGEHWTGLVDAGDIDTSAPPAPQRVPAPTERTFRAARIRTSDGELRVDVPLLPGQGRPALPVAAAERDRAGDPDPAGDRKQVEPLGGVSPMDGVLVRHTVAVGERVDATTTVAVVESMKMETHVTSGSSGTVTAVHAVAGQSLRRGDRLVTVRDEPT